MTPMMEADEIAHAFNGAGERKYWRAVVAGTRITPAVHFYSRASMVQVIYYPKLGRFTVVFSRTVCSFGDFMASAHRSLAQVLLALKAAGMDIAAPVDETGTLRLEYDPATKQVFCDMANLGDGWQAAQPLSFKVPEK